MRPAPRIVLAEYADADGVLAGAEALGRAGFRILDALTPHPLPALERAIGASASPIRPVMAAAGFATALFFFALQVYAQAYSYPINSGGRPLASWQVYPLVSFETGILAAAVAGFVTLLWRAGLPRLHHPVFAIPGIERATQDRFFLLVERPDDDVGLGRLARHVTGSGALSFREPGP